MKNKLLFLLMFLIFLVGCKKINEEEILNEFINNYTYDVNQEEFDFPKEITYNNQVISLEWNYSDNLLDENNKLIHYLGTLRSPLEVKATLGNYSVSKVLGEIVSVSLNGDEANSDEALVGEFLAQYEFKQTDDYKVELLDSVIYNDKEISLKWTLSNNILDENNYIIHNDTEIEASVVLEATLGKAVLSKNVGKINSLSLSSLSEKYHDFEKSIIEEFKETFVLEINDERVNFVKKYLVNDYLVKLDYDFDISHFYNSGKIIHTDVRRETEIFVNATIGATTEKVSMGTFVIKSISELLDEAINNVKVDREISDDIELVNSYNGVSINWSSDKKDILSDSGKCSYVKEDALVKLTGVFICSGEEIKKEYEVIVKPYSNLKRLELVLDTIDIPQVVCSNLELKNEYSYDVKAQWESSNKDIIDDSGKVNFSLANEEVKLKLKLYIGEESMEKEFNVNVATFKKLDLHYLVEKTNDFNQDNMFNLEIKDEKVSLMDGEIYGYYDSCVYETKNFEELVGSWAALSSEEATCELLIKIRVNGSWSKYFTYGIWGLGRNNLYYNQNDKIAKMSVDEILPIDGVGDAFQYRIILRRDSKECASPKLGLVAITIRIPDYEYKVDVSGLDSFVDYDVAKVNQNVVPDIGNSICSATTSTMLLKYKGFDFSEFDEYENRYIANLVADRGHNSPTYGNWVYNTVTMGAYGLSSYVKHMYSWDELKLHLATVGPVGASISGNTGLYTTAGHLIVVRGYREVDGKTYVICNDPNINERFGNDSEGNPLFVYYEFPLETFMNFWRGTVYVVE